MDKDVQHAVLIANSILGNHFESINMYEELLTVEEDPLTAFPNNPELHTAIIRSHLKAHRLKSALKMLARIPPLSATPNLISLAISSLIVIPKDCSASMNLARKYMTDRSQIITSHAAFQHSQRTRAYLLTALTTLAPNGFELDVREVESWFVVENNTSTTAASATSGASLEFLQYTCGALVDLGQFAEARVTVRQMVDVWKGLVAPTKEDNDRIVVAYSSLMRAALNQGTRDANVGSMEIVLGLTSLVDELRNLGLKPNLYCYTALMHGFYKYGGLEKLVACYQSLLKDGIEPDQAIFNLLIRGYTLENYMQNAMDLFNEMVHTRGLYPNIRVLSSFMATVGLVGDMDSCVKIFEQVEACGMKPDHTLFHVVMSGYAQACDVGSVLEWYNRLLSANLHPDVVTYTIVMLAISRSTDPEATRRWYDRIFSSKILPNVHTYSILIQDRAKRGDLVAAIHIYKDLVRVGIKPTAATFTTLINAHIAYNNAGTASETFQEAIELCHEMMTDAARPDVAVFHVMMKMFGSIGKVDQAIQIYERLKSGGVGGFGVMVEPDETMHMTAIVNYLAMENLPKVEETLREMLNRGAALGIKRYPPVVVLQTVLHKLAQLLWKRDETLERKVVDLFEAIFSEFLAVGATGSHCVLPTPELFEKLIRVTTRNFNASLSVMMYREMTKRGFADLLEPVTRDLLFKRLLQATLSTGNLHILMDAMGASVVAGTSDLDATFLNQALEPRRGGRKLLSSIEQVDSAILRLEESIRFCTPLAAAPTVSDSSPSPSLTNFGYQLSPMTRVTFPPTPPQRGLPSQTVHLLLDCFNGTPTDVAHVTRVWDRLVESPARLEISQSVVLAYVEILSRYSMWKEIVDVLTVQSVRFGWDGRRVGEYEGVLEEAFKVMGRYGSANVHAQYEKEIVMFWDSR
ncbi:hypothetical protein HDU98_001887 [Podochytrium sp. JEL0797]|nr:hypothetical protein HDU98_001887 [Podochytrium sp. JEL0797]